MDLLLIVGDVRDGLLRDVRNDVIEGEGGGIENVGDLERALEQFAKNKHLNSERRAHAAGTAPPSERTPVTGDTRVLSMRIYFVKRIPKIRTANNGGPRGNRPGSYRRVSCSTIHPHRQEIVVAGTAAGEIVATNMALPTNESHIPATIDAGVGRGAQHAHTHAVTGVRWVKEGQGHVLVSRTTHTVSVWDLTNSDTRLVRNATATCTEQLHADMPAEDLLGWVRAAQEGRMPQD